VKRGSPYQAHNSFGYLRRLFSWAIGTHQFGILVSPVERLSAKDLIGNRVARERVLTDAELRAVWDASGEMGYPYGPLIRLMILTGQREREIADMVWTEINFDQALWTIPAARMKGDRAHQVPLAPAALALLQSMPQFTKGDYLFTTTNGAKSVNGFSKAKVRIDKLSGVEGWKFHDLRRTMRTHLSALPVQDMVRELVIAHARPGLHKVYDQHTYREEKRQCLVLWELRLRIVLGHNGAPMGPKPDEVATCPR
jgi:integrase